MVQCAVSSIHVNMKYLLVLLALGAAAAYKSYDGYKLLDMVPTNTPQLEFLRSLTKGGQAIDFWEEPSHVGQNVRLNLSPEQLVKYRPQLRYHRIAFTVADENVGLSIMKEREEIEARRNSRGKVFDINDFNTYADIIGWLNGEALTKCAAAGLTCSVTIIGSSFEGRDVPMITVSSGSGNPGIYMDATTHAREWLTPATTLYLMDNMFNNYGSDADVTRMLNTYDWHFVHVVNPDGYDFSWTDERLHRKNRNTAYCPAGNRGVDLNRNYDYKHGTNGVSHQECDDTYCGPNGLSEPETTNVGNWVCANSASLYAVVTVHAYGNYLLFPWGTTTGWDQPNPDSYPCDLAADHADLNAVSEATCTAIEATYNTRWSCGNSCARIYTTSGATDDYSKGVCSVKYAYNPELRGNSFVINADQIPLSFNEFWNGMIAMADSITANPPPAP